MLDRALHGGGQAFYLQPDGLLRLDFSIYTPAGVHDGTVVTAAKGITNLLIGCPGEFACEIHCHLACEGYIGRALPAGHIGQTDIVAFGGGFLNLLW